MQITIYHEKTILSLTFTRSVHANELPRVASRLRVHIFESRRTRNSWPAARRLNAIVVRSTLPVPPSVPAEHQPDGSAKRKGLTYHNYRIRNCGPWPATRAARTMIEHDSHNRLAADTIPATGPDGPAVMTRHGV